MSVRDNVTLPRLDAFQRRGLLRSREARRDAQWWVEELGVLPRDAGVKAGTLSGGNQQKVVLGKALAIARHVLVLAEPTVGVDIGARLQIFHRIRTAASEGLTVVVCSTDVGDLVALCDRVIVLRSGRKIAEFRGGEITEAAVLSAVAGISGPGDEGVPTGALGASDG